MVNRRGNIEEYPAEFIAFLKAASLGTAQPIRLPNYNKACSVRARINTLRGLMREKDHPDYIACARASLTFARLDGTRFKSQKEAKAHEGEILLIGEPRSSDVLSAFQSAGFSPAAEETPAEDLLDKLFKGA